MIASRLLWHPYKRSHLSSPIGWLFAARWSSAWLFVRRTPCSPPFKLSDPTSTSFMRSSIIQYFASNTKSIPNNSYRRRKPWIFPPTLHQIARLSDGRVPRVSAPPRFGPCRTVDVTGASDVRRGTFSGAPKTFNSILTAGYWISAVPFRCPVELCQ